MASITVNGDLVARDFETLAIDNTAGGVGFTSTKMNKSRTTNSPYDAIQRCVEVLVTFEDQPARYTVDGTAPTTTVGHLIAAGDTAIIQGFENISKFRAIRTGGTNSAAAITYFFRA